MIQARLSRGNLNNDINVSKLPDDIKDSFAKTRLRSLITSSLQPLVDYFRNYKNIVLDIINISDNISDNVEINKFTGLEYSETLCKTLSSMINSEVNRTCIFLKNKYGDDSFYNIFLNELNSDFIASSILEIICKK